MNKKKQLEPTYLRYIYDGLIKGSIHPENAAELPEGLIGLYEEAFDERTSVIKRQKLLERFAIWALLKKEVSAAFVAEVLGETEDDIQEFISTYSAWFNSPESGKYQLYHERLKVYLLQRVNSTEIINLNEKLISVISKFKESEVIEYFLNFGYLHYWIAQIENINDERFKFLILSNDLLHNQFEKLTNYTPIFNGFKLAIQYYSFKQDPIVYELIRKANSIVSQEFDYLKIIFKKNASDIEWNEYIKLKDFSSRIGDNDSYFQFLIYALSELIFVKSENDDLFNFILNEIKDYLESDTIPLDFYIPLVCLIILVELYEKRTNELLFLFDFIYINKLVDYHDVINKNSIWVNFHHNNIYFKLSQKHFRRIFWFKNRVLSGKDSLKFIFEIWDKLNFEQKQLLINNVTLADVFLLKQAGAYYELKVHFIEILLFLKGANKIGLQEIHDIYIQLLNSNKKSNFFICHSSVYYIKSKLFDGLNLAEKRNFLLLFFSRAFKIKSSVQFEIIINQIDNEDKLLVQSDLINLATKKSTNRLKTIFQNNNSALSLRINRYFFDTKFVEADIENSVEEALGKIHSLTTWVVENVYYLALKNKYDENVLKLKIEKYNKSDPDLYYIIEGLELIHLITQYETNKENDLILDKINLLQFPPNKEVLASQVLLLTEGSSHEIINSLRKIIPKRNETERNLLNRILMSLGLIAKEKEFFKKIRILDYQNSNEFALTYSDLLPFSSALKSSNDEVVQFVFSHYEIIFDGQVNEMIFSEYFKLLDNVKTVEIIETLFSLSDRITDEFDCYGFRSSLFELDSICSNSFDIEKWINRIHEYNNPYWKDIAYSDVISYFLENNNFNSAVIYYEKYLLTESHDNYPKIRAWQNIIRYLLRVGNFNLAKTWFNELKDFPNPEFFPSEDEFKLQIFISKKNVSNFKKISEFFHAEKNDLRFENEINKFQLQLILDVICSDFEIVQFLDNFKSIMQNWYEFDVDEIFELVILENNRFEILKILKNSSFKMKEYFINLLYKNIQKNDLKDYSIYEWMIEMPSLIELHSIISWHEFLKIKNHE
jgi:hypothetical protein